MIVCSCNRLSDRDIRACCARSADCPLRVIDVYGALGCKPDCGRCGPTIATILREQRDAGCGCLPQDCPHMEMAAGV
ncbi:MAG TPA: hypothetical protein PKA55_15260 [Rhodoblastus sp.]|nr:hypothetical protein [Rhodoblastus sp.]